MNICGVARGRLDVFFEVRARISEGGAGGGFRQLARSRNTAARAAPLAPPASAPAPFSCCQLLPLALPHAPLHPRQIGFGGCWDVAAGAIILREAGGELLDPAGGPWHVNSRRVLAANGHLAPAAAAVLARCKVSASEPPAPAAAKAV
jgi:hypothetical protein